jgi:hypothetical protein
VPRLAWGLILSIALVAPDLAARSAKRSKASKSEQSEKPSSKAVSFTIARPENAGMMNGIPARVVVEPRDGIQASHLTHLGQPKAPKDGGLVLLGGDTVELAVRPGTYSVQVLTPIEMQPKGGYPPGRKSRNWESPVVKVLLERGEAITVVVEPGVSDADYNGSWVIGKAAPPAPDAPAGALPSAQEQER